ncbi:hypothetical protein D3C73_693580 [compost metagenome]
MHMRVDQTWRNERAGRIDHLRRIRARTALVDADDKRPDNTDIGGTKLAGHHIHQHAAGNQNVEGRISACDLHGIVAKARFGKFANGCDNVLHQLASAFNASRMDCLAFSASISAANCALNFALPARVSTTVRPRV